jgi:[acyl-carrier-protein] S-malonyltransferase
MNVFMFPGQGAQYVGMDEKLENYNPTAHLIFEEANDLLGYNLLQLIHEGPLEKLTVTDIAQPALFVMNYIYQKIISETVKPDIVMGHSLGEYAALACAKTFSFKEGLRLVQKRGELMARASVEIPGKMVALNRVTQEEITPVIEECKHLGIIEITNFNSPKQFVLSGEDRPIDEAVDIIKSRKICTAIPLNVSAPFHSSIMKSISGDFRNYLNSIEFNDPDPLFIDNVTGTIEKDASNIREKLVEQLYRPVLWVQSITSAVTAGGKDFYECGPGQVLSGLVKRYDRKLSILQGEEIVAS